MRSNRLLWCAWLILALALGIGCAQKSESSAGEPAVARAGPPIVVTTIEVNRYLAARIGGARVDVRSPVPPEADPLGWEPTRDTIAVFQDADLVILNGAGLEGWRDRVTLRPSSTITLADAYAAEWLTFSGTVEHQHGPEGSHSHSGTDPHIWFDPQLVKKHATQITEALATRFPEHAAEFRVRGSEVETDLDDLDQRFRSPEGKTLPPLLANHPAYDYAARRFGWSIENHTLDPEQVVTPDVAAVASTGRNVLLWESPPAAAVRAAFEAAGITSVVVSPCEQPPASGDWLSVMQENAQRIRALARDP